MTEKHDPREVAQQLQQLLISDKKRIGFLFGAGTSAAGPIVSATIPTVAKMTQLIVDALGEENAKYKKAIFEIKEELVDKAFNIEQILSNIEQKIDIVGSHSMNGMDKDELKIFHKKIETKILEMVSVHKKIKEEKIGELIHSDFGEWISQADRRTAVEIFTTNYDYLFEMGLEYKGIPYFDGFTGAYEPFFDSEAVAEMNHLNTQTKLWKVHGSLGWKIKKDEENQTTRIIRKYTGDDDILIYPSSLKYSNSQKLPYVALLDRLTEFLKHDDALLITCGYSFGDAHINERIFTALRTRTTAHVVGLIYDKFVNEKGETEYLFNKESGFFKKAKQVSKISILGQKYGLIGCKLGEWILQNEPDKNDTININAFFDEDAPKNDTMKKGDPPVTTAEWTGKGEFTLPDFQKLVNFLKQMIPDRLRNAKNEN